MTAEIPSTPSRPYGMRRDLATASWQNRSPSYWIRKRIKMTTRLLVRGGHFEYKYTVDARPRAKKNSWSGTADRIRKFSRHPIVQRSPARDPNIFRFQTLHQIRPRIKIQIMVTTQSLIPGAPRHPLCGRRGKPWNRHTIVKKATWNKIVIVFVLVSDCSKREESHFHVWNIKLGEWRWHNKRCL